MGKKRTFQNLFKIYSKFISKLIDSHTEIEDENAIKFFSENYFPFPIIIENGKVYFDNFVYVKGAPNKKELIGKEIIAINDHSMKNLLSEIFSLLDAEDFSNRIIQQNFSVYLKYVMNNNNNKYRITYLDSKKKKSFTVPISVKPVLNVSNPHHTDKKPKLYFINEKTALLEVVTFRLNLTNFSNNLIKNFKEINKKNITNLIIDLRKNTGGYFFNADELYNYIIYQENKLENFFYGDIYVLTSPLTYSAAIEFIVEAKKANDKITLVGTSPGGTKKTYGTAVIGYLEKTNFKVRIATSEYNKKLNETEEINPDIEIKSGYSITNTSFDEDIYLKVVKEEIKRRENKN